MLLHSMKLSKKAWWAGLGGALLLSASACGSGASASAAHQSPETFYHGKTLTIIVPYGAAGGYNAWARLVGKYIQKPLGVGRVIVVNKPGGGGLVGANDLFHSTPNGLTIGDTNAAGDVFDRIFKAPGEKFNPAQVAWLGRPDNEHQVIVLGPGGPGAPRGGYTAMAQLEHLPAGRHVTLLSSGLGSSGYYGLETFFNALGVPFHMLAAYKGSHATVAGLLRGDGNVTMFGYGSLRSLIQAGKLRAVAVQAKHPWSQLAHVPSTIQLATTDHVNPAKVQVLKAIAGVLRMGHAFAAPSGIPATRLAFLRKAFHQAVTSPGFVAAAKKERRYLQYAPGSAIAHEVQTALQEARKIRTLAN